ncbi:hypothetical protein BO83DRAFT_445576 [Aspergillus eucalypticola CBS 122712]|uniref:NRPS-like enzyme n=1 Tax=Aspergillus eucalypticola (strain CBS 122712 / IBT 29274) TaxID=1448314 RepID=A0A317VE43_ASPEC|nr:uncharacterized protein BO83DRAFT_445576 [Aspergillus eucalypticola CBS 122712]PWY72566.1 hypothetical protein BO83DRAFT_445576 [Aspergillus eucalypticola CBS 122712]
MDDVKGLPAPRLLIDVVSKTAGDIPSKIWGSIARNPMDAVDGYDDISFSRPATAVDRAAFWIRDHIGKGISEAQSKFETLAYLGPPDSRYIILALAAVKAGFQMLFLSTRNSDEAQYAVMNEAGCQKMVCSKSMKDRVQSLLAARPSNNGPTSIFVVAEQEELLEDTPVPEFPYHKTVETARFDPLVSLHTSRLANLGLAYPDIFIQANSRSSSSTTGIPKLVRFNQGYGFHEDILQYYPKHGDWDILTRKPFYGQCRLFLAFPLFHAGGVLLGLLKSLYHDIMMVFQPQGVPLSGTVVDSIIHHDSCNLGGPMSKATGDALIARQPNCHHYIGSTEIGLLPLLELHDPIQDWQYFHFHPWSGVEMRPVGGGLNLYSPHPTKTNHWRPVGRADDVLVLSNGEKLNPVDMESALTTRHPAITGALVNGQGKFQPGLLLEITGVDMHGETEKRKLVDEIWPFVAEANKKAPKHGQLTKSLVLFSSPEKPFLRTPKYSIRRQPTIALYADKIEKMFLRVEENPSEMGNDDVPPGIDLRMPESVTPFIEQLVLRVTGWSFPIDPDSDLFMLGLDSLHVLRMARAMQFALLNLSIRKQVDAKVIYGSPSITALSTMLKTILYQSSSGSEVEDEKLTREERIQKIINRWVWTTPPRKLAGGDCHKSSYWTVALTGSTGSLGTFLLSALIGHPRIEKVICINRSAIAAQKWEEFDLAQERKARKQCPVTFYQTNNIGAEFFGLPEEVYESLRLEVTHVIHNAWPVNFNLSLESYEEIHIAGVRRLIDFSSESTKGTKICFVSSLSSVRSRDGLIPENVIPNLSAPAHMGYGESKFVAEMLLEMATVSSNGAVPSTILRIGQIAGPIGQSRAAWNAQEWFPSILTTSKSLGVLPITLGGMESMNWIPVDILAQVIIEILDSEEKDEVATSSRVYHLTNPVSSMWNRYALPVVRRLLNISRAEPLSKWIDCVATGPEPDDPHTPNPARKILGFYRSLLASESNYECVKAPQKSLTLKELGSVRPEWIRKWLEDLKLV